jgi:hypothetical protein
MDFRKDTHNLDEALSDITLRKQRAAQARSAGTQAGLEAPRDVYLRACEEISSLL